MLGERKFLLVEGDVHARQRKVLASAFPTSAIRHMESTFFEQGLLLADLLEQNIRAAPGRSRCVEMLDWLNRAPLDVIGAAAFGYEVDSLCNPEASFREAYLAIFSFDFMARGTWLRLYTDAVKYLQCKIDRVYESTGQAVTDIATSIVRSKLETDEASPARKDIISLIVNHNKSLPEREGP